VLTSRADVATDAPDRYAKQLASHLGRRLTVQEEESSTVLVFEGGSCRLTPDGAVLRMGAEAQDAEVLARVQDVVGRHLERFGQRNELVVTWQPTDQHE
jgi:hypothetical protein